MLGYLLLAVVAYVAVCTSQRLLSWRHHVAEARSSGIRYVPVPFYVYGLPMLLFARPIMRFFKRFPRSWVEPWVDVISPMHSWFDLYSTFEKLGSDTYLTSSPYGNMLWTADADVISQITSRKSDFPKSISMYKNIEIFGKNVVTTEGPEWRHHRKVVAPPFSEQNNNLVWDESIHQAQEMMRSWTGENGDEAKTIRTAPQDTMRLALYVISRAGFDQRLLWPGREDAKPSRLNPDVKHGNENHTIREGHQMTYVDALVTVLENLVPIAAFGKMLEYFPTRAGRETFKGWQEWAKYLDEMLRDKKAEIDSGSQHSGIDLMGSMIRSSKGDDSTKSKGALADSEILGNSFVFVLAGHETSANTIHFSIVYLAMHPEVQRKLQKDVDSVFQGRPTDEWDYDKDLPKLFGGMIGAVMSEELRLIPPVIEIPKTTHTAQPLIVDGKECTVPANCYVSLSTAAAHRNPKYWPHGPPSDPKKPVHPRSNLTNDLEEFKPERWLENRKAEHTVSVTANGSAGDDSEDDATGGPTAATASLLYKPPKGAYLPFSDGARSCLGKRFAQVEILIVLAVIFSQWSVELALDDFASPEEIAKMSNEEYQSTWIQARDRVQAIFREKMASKITLKMAGTTHIPLRFVKRGKEWSS